MDCKSILNAKSQNIKPPEDNIGENVGELRFGSELQIYHQKQNPEKKKIISWISLQLKPSVKDIVKRMNGKQLGENICQTYI